MTHETSATTSTTNGARPENPFAESFNGRLRDECLRIDWFMSLSHASLSNLVSLTLSHKNRVAICSMPTTPSVPGSWVLLSHSRAHLRLQGADVDAQHHHFLRANWRQTIRRRARACR